MNKAEELLNELHADITDLQDGTLTAERFSDRELARMNRYALAVVEQSLPEEKPEPLHSLRDTPDHDRACGWNNCRDEVKLNALRIVGGGEEKQPK